MTINQVSYQKTFNLGNYSSERIGVEMVLNEGEDAKEALNTAKELVEEYHKDNDRQAEDFFPMAQSYPISELPVIQVDKGPSLEDQIRSCTELKVLKIYESFTKGNPILQEAYNQTMKSLTIK